jgi:hypothetical protein
VILKRRSIHLWDCGVSPKAAFGLGIPNDLVNQAAKFMLSLYGLIENGLSLLEMNPFL